MHLFTGPASKVKEIPFVFEISAMILPNGAILISVNEGIVIPLNYILLPISFVFFWNQSI